MRKSDLLAPARAVLLRGSAAFALALSGCGGGSADNASALTNNAAPIPQIAAPNNGDWTETVSATERGGYLMGNPNAPVKLIEYGSISCPVCARFSVEGFQPLTSRYVRSGQVSWEFRPFLIHAQDPGVFLLLHCLGPQPFFRVAEQLYATQQDWIGRSVNMPPEQAQQLQNMDPHGQAAAMVRVMGLDQFFRQRGLPEARMNACLADDAALQQLGEISRRATSEENVQGTPTFIVNGEKLDSSDWASLEARLRGAIGG
jgi:protein-disulfide isomerase